MDHISPLRVALVAILFLVLYGTAAVHVFFMQTVQGNFFTHIAKKQYQISLTQRPPRAPIADRNKNPLALNKEIFSAFIIPNNLQEKDRVYEFIKHHFPEAWGRLTRKKDACFIYIKRNMSPQELDFITRANLPDLQILREEGRFYPHPSLGQTIGLTNIDNDGIAGIELIFNQYLAGSPTTYLLEKDARSQKHYFKKETKKSGNTGLPIRLTIDSNLQFIAYEAVKERVESLGALEGMGLIMDPVNGDILAMACFPDFDPNKPVSDLALTKNKTLTESHEFGSAMKVFTAMAALEEKKVTPDEIIDCENKKETYIDGVHITTWKAFGKLTYTDVIRNSNNIGTSKVALRIDAPRYYTHLRNCGFSRQTGLGYPGEQIGSLNPPEKWSKLTIPHLSFGYEISATLLQLARAFGIISNGGYLVTPRLIIEPAPKKITPPERVFSRETIAQIRNITAFNTETNFEPTGLIPGYTVMGKTGSALMITNGKYDPSRSLYTFVGAVEKGNYRRVIAVTIREPRPTAGHTYASTVALPLFKEIAERMLIHDRILPDNRPT